MTLHFCERWFIGHKRPLRMLTEPQARRLHEQGRLYTALLGDDPSCPNRIVEIRLEAMYTGVGFLDQRLREWRVHTFGRRPLRAGWLFKGQTTIRTYFGDRDDIQLGTSYLADQSGRVVISTTQMPERQELYHERQCDVSMHWEPVPKFGEYESISRLDHPTDFEVKVLTLDELRAMGTFDPEERARSEG